MNNKLLSKILLSLVLLIIAACSQKIIPDQPVVGQLDTPPLPKESALQLPISIPLNDINKFIDKVVPQEIYKGKEVGSDKMMMDLLVGKVEKDYGWEVLYSVKKNGKITVNIDNEGVLIFSIPLRIDAFGCATISLGTPLRKCGTSSPEVDLLIKTKINFNPDWSIKSSTKISYDLKKADLLIPFKIGEFPPFNLKLNIKNDLQKPIDAQLESMGKEIDKYISNYIKDLKLKNLVAQYWSEYSTSMALSNSPPLYLNIQPKRIVMDGFSKSKNDLTTAVGIYAMLSLSSKPQIVEKLPLPNLENSKIGKNSELQIPVSYGFDSLSRYLEALYMDTIISGDGYRLTVKGISMMGLGKYVLVELKYNAKIKGVLKTVKGKMYFRTLPAFDAANNTFYLEECQMTSETNSILMDGGLKYLANRSLNEDIMRMSRYDLTNELNETVKMINLEIGSLKMANMELNGHVDRIVFDGFFVEPKQINIYFKGIGKIKSNVVLLD